MVRQVFKASLPVGLITLLSGALFGGYLTTCQLDWLQEISREIQATCRDTSTQWMVVVCLVSYFVTFLILERRLNSTSHASLLLSRVTRFAFFRCQNPNFFLTGFVVLVLLPYAVDYTNAAKSLQVVVLLAGIVIGKGVALCASWEKTRALEFQSIDQAQICLWGLLLLLASVALWQPNFGMEFHYRGIHRWKGVWDNPNTYGELMAVGAVVAVGLIIFGVWRLGDRPRPIPASLILLAVLFAAAGLCGFGLLRSYSRGAWLATVAALALILVRLLKHQVATVTAGWTGLRRNWFPSSILLFSVLVICYWQFRYTESPLLRRAFSIGNVNDFSWRNRVTAWQGAGHMILDKPLAGFGWGKSEEAYRKEYRPARLEETAAIQLNDYLMLGTSAGVPALICLLAYVALIGRRVLRGKSDTVEFRTSAFSFQTVCGAGATVLLIGFWFDGGLFNLPTAVVFWILLELARCGGRDNGAQRDPSGKGEPSLDEPNGSKANRVELALRWLAGIVAAFAIGQTVLHVGVPQLAIGERTLRLARNYLISPREETDFEFVAAKQIWSGQPLKVLLQHARLANYNRELVNWKVEDATYQSLVLSPEVSPAFDGDMNWRRQLWEHFFPRIRKETSMTAAAETVGRGLREQVKIVPTAEAPKTITEMWRQERADIRGFEAIGVAAMRSVGIPARLSTLGLAEFWNGTEWKSASGKSAP